MILSVQIDHKYSVCSFGQNEGGGKHYLLVKSKIQHLGPTDQKPMFTDNKFTSCNQEEIHMFPE